MRSDSLLLILALLFVWEGLIPAQGRPAREFGDGAPLTTSAAHLKLKSAEWRSLNEKQIVTRALAGSHAKEVAGFAAVVADATPEEFIKAFSALSVFKRSETTLACGRFSAQPVIEDLAGLEINDKDLYSLMRAKVKESDIKLTETDIARIRVAAGPSPYFSPKLKAKLAAEYKQILLDKARAYAESGETALDSYADQEEAVSARDAGAAMVKSQATAAGHNPHLYSLFSQSPRDAAQNTESFLYWAMQKFGQLKPVISLVHVVIYRENDRVFIASKQVYSSHYTEAGLSVAELIPIIDEKGAKRTLAAYTIRLQVDMLGGSMGFLKRRAAQPRMLETLKTGLEGLRRCAESLLAERQL
jgi:hypothetical protein